MTDLIALMSSLLDNKGRILIPHIYDSVEPLTPAESASYDSIDFDMASVYWLLQNICKFCIVFYSLPGVNPRCIYLCRLASNAA